MLSEGNEVFFTKHRQRNGRAENKTFVTDNNMTMEVCTQSAIRFFI